CSGGHEELAGGKFLAVVQGDEKSGAVGGCAGHAGVQHFGAIALCLGAAACQQSQRTDPLITEQAVGCRGRRVAWVPGINDGGGASCPGQGQGRTQPGGSPADNDDVAEWCWSTIR